MAISQMIGARIHRREDPHLITGGGRYVEDLVKAGTLTMAVVRSPHPHARIKSINSSAAKAIQGVVAVLTAADFKSVLSGTHPVAPAFVAEKHTVPERFPLADGETVFQGEPVAVVLAENRKLAVDAAEAVEVEYEPLPAVIDIMTPLGSSRPKTHTNLPHKLAWELPVRPAHAGQDTFAHAP